jgi:salicylate hydroxylase
MMSVTGKDFGIIGGGIGGMATAIAIAQLGGRVTVFEQASKLGEVGAGIQISANGLAVLAELGVDPEHAGPASRPQVIELRDYKAGRFVARIRQNQNPDYPYLQLHRADLMAALVARAYALGVTIKLGAQAEIVDAFVERPEIRVGKNKHSFDAIIGADGVNSQTRQDWFEAGPAKFTGQVAWRATIPADDPNARTTVYMGWGKHLVTYPLRGGKMINIVAVQERKSTAPQDWENTDTPVNLRTAFAEFGGDAQSILKQVKKVRVWGLYGHPPLQTWSRAHVALLGDAVHPMFPFMAQGACMALEDASDLARSLDDTDYTRLGLARYETKRKRRATKVQRLAARNGRVFHLSNPLIRWIAQSVLTVISTILPSFLERRFDWIYKNQLSQEVGFRVIFAVLFGR